MVVRRDARHQRRPARQAPGARRERTADPRRGLRHRQQPRAFPRPRPRGGGRPLGRCAPLLPEPGRAGGPRQRARAALRTRRVRPRDLVRRAVPPLGDRRPRRRRRAGARPRPRWPAARAGAGLEDVVGRARRRRPVAASLHPRRGRRRCCAAPGSTCSSSRTRTPCSSRCSRCGATLDRLTGRHGSDVSFLPAPVEAAFLGLLRAEARMVRHVRLPVGRQRPRPGPQAD